VPAVPEDEAASLSGALSVPRVVARLLWLRGLRAPAEALEFLSPRLARLESPDALPDLAVAAERVAAAVARGERVAVCGDYDVDGMTGTALLVRFLRIAGADVVYEIPDREADGYGLSVAGVERLQARGVRLAITVDNGVSAFEALERARAVGIDVVVTDHHLPGASLPPAAAIVDPHRTDVPRSGAPSALCGCGLAFKLAWGVAERMQRTRRDDRLRGFLRDAVGLVALATVADVVPLTGENRVLVHAGLLALRATPHAGVRALCASAGLSGSSPLSTDDVVWRLAPRLNAAGRLNRPDLAIDLLTTEDPATASRLAAEIEAANESRRAIEKDVVAAAVEQARERLLVGERRSLVVAGDGWHRGVIGIVAARLVDAHDRPTVVIGLDGDGGRGSCRTPRGVDLHAALSRCSAHLRRYGGHAAAAGLEIDRGALPAFVEAFEEAVRAQAGNAADDDSPAVDGEATPGDFDLACAEAIRRLAPFGHGNPEPRFLLRGAVVAGRPRLLGAGSEHLSFALKTPLGAVRVVAFRRARLFDLAAAGVPLDLVVTPTVNEWRGVRSAELVAHDIGRSQGGP
jgi:single-stranded-DNA-specific exonuclease